MRKPSGLLRGPAVVDAQAALKGSDDGTAAARAESDKGESGPPRCGCGNDMLVSSFAGPGYGEGCCCVRCGGLSSQGHCDGTRERWCCRTYEMDVCFVCAPRSEPQVATAARHATAQSTTDTNCEAGEQQPPRCPSGHEMCVMTSPEKPPAVSTPWMAFPVLAAPGAAWKASATTASAGSASCARPTCASLASHGPKKEVQQQR